jgi:predicted PurR-regulated permease PerM
MGSVSSWTTRNIVVTTLAISGLVALLVLMIAFAQVVFSIFLALTLSIALEPAVNWLQKKRFRRLTGALLVHGAVLLALAAMAATLLPLILSQVGALANQLPEYYTTIRDMLNHSPVLLIQAIGAQLPLQLGDFLYTFTPTEEETPWPVIVQVGASIFDLFIIFLLSFYWTMDNQRAIRFFLVKLQENQREQVRTLIDTLKEKVGAYLRGQVLLCLIVGAMSLAAYLLMGLPYAFSLAVVAGIFEALPMIGPVLGLIPAVLLAMAVAPDKILWVLLAGTIIQQLENNLLVPRVMDRAVGVSPVVSILAIGAFATLFGIGGAFLAIPVVAVLQALLDRFIFSNPDLLSGVEDLPVKGSGAQGGGASPIMTANGVQGLTDDANYLAGETPAPSTPGRGRLSVIHMELNELTQDIRKQQREKDPETDITVDEIEDALEVTAGILYNMLQQHISSQNDQGAETEEPA